MTDNWLYEFLEEKVVEYNQKSFIDSDPVSIPHEFDKKEDIEISAFLTATIAWGRRSMIIANARKMMQLLENTPYDFVMNASEDELKRLQSFKHRTFNGDDLRLFVWRMRDIYRNSGGLENALLNTPDNLAVSISNFKKMFFALTPDSRSVKHISDPLKHSAAKRINMFLRWMVRKDKAGVDFGLWKRISPAALKIPLDVHSGNTARKLGLLHRKQNDWKSVEELTAQLQMFDPDDPVKYDYALFGLGVFERF